MARVGPHGSAHAFDDIGRCPTPLSALVDMIEEKLLFVMWWSKLQGRMFTKGKKDCMGAVMKVGRCNNYEHE